MKKKLALAIASAFLITSVAEAATYRSTTSSSRTPSSSSPSVIPSGDIGVNSAKGAGEINLDGIGSCTPGVESGDGVVDTGVVLGTGKSEGTEAYESKTETAVEGATAGTTNSILENSTWNPIDVETQSVDASVYVRFVKPINKDVENISCQKMVEQGIAIAEATARKIQVEAQIAEMQAEIQKKKAELELRELEFKLNQLEKGEEVAKETVVTPSNNGVASPSVARPPVSSSRPISTTRPSTVIRR